MNREPVGRIAMRLYIMRFYGRAFLAGGTDFGWPVGRIAMRLYKNGRM